LAGGRGGGVEREGPRLTLIPEGLDLSEAKQHERFCRPVAVT